MTDPAPDIKPQKPFFVNQFVNTVYGIILGTGVVNSARQIEREIAVVDSEALDASLGGLSTIFSIATVIYVIIVVCVYWWDWIDSVGYRVKNTGREFVIDISILLSLECLFFVFRYPIPFSSTFFLLAILNLCWVYNFRFEEYQRIKSRNTIKSWSEFLDQSQKAKRHIRKRWYGVGLYAVPLLFAIVGKVLGVNEQLKKANWIFSDNWTEIWAWAILTIIIIVGFINRRYLYRDRF